MKILALNRFSTLDRMGGTYRYIDDLSKELVKRGHEVHLLCKKEHAKSGRFTTQILPGYWIHQFGVARKNPVVNTWRYMKMFRDIAEELDRQYYFDAICLHDAQIGYLLMQSPLIQRIPLTYFFYAPAFSEFSYKSSFARNSLSIHKKIPNWIYSKFFETFQWFIENHLLMKAEYIVALSQFSVSQLNQFFTLNKDKKITVIPSGVNIHRFSPTKDSVRVRRNMGLPQDTTILLTVRNLMPRMGLDNLIVAMRTVIKHFPKMKLLLLIGGKGPLKELLTAKINELQLNNSIRLLGYIPDEELPHYYQAADFFILPTAALEGFGIATIEALATNTPVIGTSIGATPEILNKAGGFLAKSASPEDLTAKIIEVLENKEKILHVWSSSDFVKENYSWEVVGGKMENLLSQIVATHPASRYKHIHS